MHRTAQRPFTALTGSTGFIGAAILEHLSRDSNVPLRALTRRPNVAPSADPAMYVRGELEDVSSLEHLCEGATTLIHAASYVGTDSDLQSRVNVDGTRSLMRAATSQGVQQVIYVSTAGVYGRSFPADRGPHGFVCVPESTLSESRLEAEAIVRAVGGTVVRPNYVVGVGDRWVVPQLLAAIQSYGSLQGWATSRWSLITRTALAELVGRLSRLRDLEPVYHAAYAEPVTLGRLVRPFLDARAVDLPATSPHSLRDHFGHLKHGERISRLLEEDRTFDAVPLLERTKTQEKMRSFVWDTGSVDWYLAHVLPQTWV